MRLIDKRNENLSLSLLGMWQQAPDITVGMAVEGSLSEPQTESGENELKMTKDFLDLKAYSQCYTSSSKATPINKTILLHVYWKR